MTEDKDWIDELLLAERATPVHDDGFSARLISRLPARRTGLQTWIAPAMTVVGGILAIFALGGFDGAVSAFRGGSVPLFALLPIAIVFAGCAWAFSESR